jgi:O-succinylbenzoate synthase
MKIEQIEVYHVSMPLVYPFRTSFGNTDAVESVLVCLRNGGLEGWGETAPWSPPLYSTEYAGGVFAVIRDFLAPRLIGQEIANGLALQEFLKPIKGNYFAKAGLDLAWWDLHARSRNEPLWKTIGGRGPVADVGADIGIMGTLPELMAEIAKTMAQGFKRLKLRYRPGWDLNMVTAVRKEFPHIVMHVDCNSAYTPADKPMFRKLDQFQLAMIEQPMSHDDLLDHAELRKTLKTPLCLDESIYTVAQAEKAIRLGACDWINIKHGRLGGLTHALAVHDLCLLHGVKNWVGGMLESTVGQGFSIALGTMENMKYAADIFPTSRFYKEDLGDPGLELSGPSQVRALEAPGIGFRPHPGRLQKCSLQKVSITGKKLVS